MVRTAKSLAAGLSFSLSVLAATGTASPNEPAKAPTSADLAGRWTLNKELSDDAREKMREEMSKRGGAGGGGGTGRPAGGKGGSGGGMGGPGGGSGGRGAPPAAGGGGDPREAMRAILEPAEELVIAQSEAEISVDEKFGRMRRLHPDGKKYKADYGASEIKSHWKEGRLVVETRRDRGSSIETWERVPDASRLIVIVRLEGGVGSKLELKRIYDRAPVAPEGVER